DKSYNPAILRQIGRATVSGSVKPGNTQMTLHQGIAGRCYRQVATYLVNLGESDFISQMLEWGFTADEARRFSPRRSYLCTPILDWRNDVIAVLCLDTLTENQFTPEQAEVIERITPFFARLLSDSEFLDTPENYSGMLTNPAAKTVESASQDEKHAVI